MDLLPPSVTLAHSTSCHVSILAIRCRTHPPHLPSPSIPGLIPEGWLRGIMLFIRACRLSSLLLTLNKEFLLDRLMTACISYEVATLRLSGTPLGSKDTKQGLGSEAWRFLGDYKVRVWGG